MANQFIGFPVPRARIAEMIEGEAAPKDHHADHEDGGSDEVDCTGLEGAGGISLPFDDLLYHEFFSHISGFSVTNFGSGQGDVVNGQLNCIPNYGVDSFVRIRKDPGYLYVPVSWAKNREFRSKASLYADPDPGLIGYICTGDIRVGYGFGFIYENNHLYARTKSSEGTTNVDIGDFSAWGICGQYSLRAKLTAGTRVEFWVDGTLETTITTTLPTGTTYSDRLLYVEADNNNTGAENYIQMHEYQLRQEA